MVELARDRVQERARFRVHDLESPIEWLEPASFDLALMALVIHHLDDRAAALREMHRILRPDGALVVSTHHPTSDWVHRGGSYSTVSVIEEPWSRGWNVRFWRMPLTRIVAEFTDAGFVIERLVELRPSPRCRRTSRRLRETRVGARFHRAPTHQALTPNPLSDDPPEGLDALFETERTHSSILVRPSRTRRWRGRR
jgi:SAM-dependent methyltransferase